MRFPRSCGILVHPTSFPSPFGTGDFGPGADSFLELLEQTNQSIWQVLPLTPIGYGDSPYASYSAFAGNTLLISPERLIEQGWLTHDEVYAHTVESRWKADYGRSRQLREPLFRLAYNRFKAQKGGVKKAHKRQMDAYTHANQHWLPEYALFITLAQEANFSPWTTWDAGLRKRTKTALDKARSHYDEEIDYQMWLQWVFSTQWSALKKRANDKGIRIVGDIPIFVDHNSADVWVHRKQFALDKDGHPTHVAGVPPDYFSETGQRWGNPHYRWATMAKDGYSWWVQRFAQMFHLFDAIRVDHFRGFDEYWEIPADEPTAIHGRWVKGPRHDLFETIREKLGDLPIIAEDLGLTTPTVEQLRDDFDFPGMKILQFAFDSDESNSFLPHNYPQNCVVYTGTHDNDTSVGWYDQASEEERHRMRVYTRSSGDDVAWELIRLAMYSTADQAIIPLQDYLALPGEHRMNFPGTVGSNWKWRYTPQMLDNLDRDRMRELISLSYRGRDKGNPAVSASNPSAGT